MGENRWERWRPFPGAASVACEVLVLAAYVVRAAAVLAAGGVIFAAVLVRLAPRGGVGEVCGVARQMLRSPVRSPGAPPERRGSRRAGHRGATPIPAVLRLFALPRRRCRILQDSRTRRLQEAVVTLALVRLLGLTTTAAEVRTLSRFSSVPWILESLTTAAGRPRREQMQLVLPAVVRGLALHRAWMELGSSDGGAMPGARTGAGPRRQPAAIPAAEPGAGPTAERGAEPAVGPAASPRPLPWARFAMSAVATMPGTRPRPPSAAKRRVSPGGSQLPEDQLPENQPLRRSRRVLYPRALTRQKAALRAASLKRRLDLYRRSTAVAADLKVFRLYLEVIPALHRLAAHPAVAVRFQKKCDGTVSRLQDRLHRYHPPTPQGGPYGRME